MSVRVGRGLLFLCLSAAPLPGCSRVAHLTPSEQKSFGTRTFAAPLDRTFESARRALTGLGYTVAFVDVRGGRITTERKFYGVSASIGLDGRSATTTYIQLDLRLQVVDAGHTRVTAVPHQYEGERDVSRERTWHLDGDDGLHAHWKSLFRSIEAGL